MQENMITAILQSFGTYMFMFLFLIVLMYGAKEFVSMIYKKYINTKSIKRFEILMLKDEYISIKSSYDNGYFKYIIIDKNKKVITN